MAVGYYPGCALHGTSNEYDRSIRKVNDIMGVDLVEINDWNCCGASSSHMTSHKLNVALNMRNLSLIESQEFKEVLAPCPLCSKAMIEVDKELKEHPDLKNEISQEIGIKYNNTVKIINYLQFVEKYYLDKLDEKIKVKFEGIKAVCYYGCLLTRPPKILQFDDAEQPTVMDEIVRRIGLEPLDWSFKTECCGAGFALSKTESVVHLCNKILTNAKDVGADIVVVACPMCHANLDMRQSNIAREYGTKFKLPILYLSELIGLALGLTPKELGINKHFTNANKVFEKFVRV